jgi:hypothetical protein
VSIDAVYDPASRFASSRRRDENQAKKKRTRECASDWFHVSGRSVIAGSIYKTCVSPKYFSGNRLPFSFTLPPKPLHHHSAEDAQS